MWLTVEHVTRFTYDAPIAEAYTELRLKPAHRDGQRCSSFTLGTLPAGRAISEYTDRFGNQVQHFDLQGAHDEVVVTARSEVWTAPSFPTTSAPPTLLDSFDFLRPSPYVQIDGAVAELARGAGGGVRRDGPGARAGGEREAALALMSAVADRLVYQPGATDVWTPSGEALARGRGVCQDFSHVLIGACRSSALPARYVSGYLLDPALGDENHAESHAWVDVFTRDHGWLSLDPTHRCEQNERYVRVATGRDYADVPPTRGVYKGVAQERLEVAVRLRAL